MRKLVLIAILWSFAAQSLALAISPGCDMAMQNAADTADHTMEHGGEHPMDHSIEDRGMTHDMPCCDTADAATQDPLNVTASDMSAELCQLTCGSGVCSLAMVAQDPLMPPVMNSAPYPGATSAPISPAPQNLLRPPRRA